MKKCQTELKRTRNLFSGVTLIAATLILDACGDKPQPPAPPPPKLFQQDRDALDKARTVEQTDAKGADDLKREEEKQTSSLVGLRTCRDIIK
jgi:hypothetical protein